MEDGQMQVKRLGILLLILSGVWIITALAQIKLPERHQDELLDRMGGKMLTKQKEQLAFTIKNSASQLERELSAQLMDKLFQTNYNLTSQQQPFCLIVRHFQTENLSDQDLITPKSILKQKYNNFKVVYLIQKNNQKKSKLSNYFTNNSLSIDKFIFIQSSSQSVIALMAASDACDKDALMLILQNKQKFISSHVLKLLNSRFGKNEQKVVYANSLYSNNRIGFSCIYSLNIKKDKLYRKYPFAANDVLTFRNSLLLKNKDKLLQNGSISPLWMPESYGFTLLETAQSTTYIPQILTFKSSNDTLLSQRSPFQKSISEQIRQDNSILKVLHQHINSLRGNE